MPVSDTDPTRLGKVEDVSGSRISVKLDDDTGHGLVFVRGEGYRVGQVGSFVRMPAGYVDLFGIVVQVGAGAAPGPPELATQLGSRWLSVELVGEGRRGGRFERGISQYPSIGDAVHVVTETDLRSVYAPTDADSHISIGRVASAEGIRAYLDLNRFVSRHSAVVGSTGAGKSTTVASLLAAISDERKFPAARIVLLDLHGEYTAAFGDRATVFRVGADGTKGEQELHVPFWALTADELLTVMFGGTAGAQPSALQDRIASMRRDGKPGGEAHNMPSANVTADTPLPFCIHRCWYDLHCRHYATHTRSKSQGQDQDSLAWANDPTTNALDRGDPMQVTRPRFRPTKDVLNDQDKIYLSAHANDARAYVDTLEARLRDPRLQFIFEPGDWSVGENGETKKDLDALLATWLCSSKPICVFDLSGIPKAVLDDLVGAMLRIMYDAIFWGRRMAEGGRDRPLLIVLEEAHVYLGTGIKSRASAVARQVAKEGRKYGVGLMLVSQRPSELDSTILSQCGTTIAMRLTNEADRSHVRSCSSDSLDGLFAMLPILRTGEALIVGEAVNLPVRTMVDLPPKGRRPDSEDPKVIPDKAEEEVRRPRRGWTERRESEDYKPVVKAWRTQNP